MGRIPGCILRWPCATLKLLIRVPPASAYSVWPSEYLRRSVLCPEPEAPNHFQALRVEQDVLLNV